MRRPPFDIDHFQYRLIVDAMNEATAAYWLRRARAFADALPRDGDFMGAATPAQHAQRARANAARVEACIHRAGVGTELTSTETQLILDTIADSRAKAARYLKTNEVAA